MDKVAHWNEVFRSVEVMEYYDKPPNPDIVKIAGIMTPGSSVLDLGCGMGGGGVYLAERGFEVAAVDFSRTAVEALETECGRRGLRVKTARQDLRDFRFERRYDLIIAHGSLQFLERRCWGRLIAEAKAHTNPGGINFVAVFTDKIPTPPDMEDAIGDVFGEGELFILYADWETVARESYVKEDEHSGGIKHRHPIEKIIARKRISAAEC